MSKILSKFESARTLFLVLLAFLTATFLAIALNIPVLRQLLGSAFLAFVPGLLLLYVLKVRADLATRFVLSVGLSTALVILLGMSVSSVGTAFGYARPLTALPLFLSFGGATALLAALAYMRNRGARFSRPELRLATREKALLIPPALFLFLALAGTFVIKTTGSNILLVALYIGIGAYALGITLWHTRVPERLYPTVILLMSVSLVLVAALRSNHLIGSDMHDEFRLFQTTFDNARWGIAEGSMLNTALSVSILPSVYQVFLKVSPEYLFMLLFPLIVSVIPLVVYIITRKYVAGFYAFLGTFFFMSQKTFLDTHGRTGIAILFFALAIMALFHDDLSPIAKRIMFMVFSVGVVASHYSSTYIYFFLLLLAWIAASTPVYVRKVIDIVRGRSAESASNIAGLPEAGGAGSVRGITGETVALVLVLLYFWYGQVTAVAFDTALWLLRRAAALNQAFLLEAKGGTVSGAVGVDIVSVPQRLRVLLSWASVALIATGVLATLAKHRTMVGTGGPPGNVKHRFLRSRFDGDFFALGLAGSAVLGLAVTLPYISAYYDLERASFITLPILATFFVVGGTMAARLVKIRAGWLIGGLAVLFFSTTTGLTYQAFQIPASLTLNSQGLEYDSWYVTDRDSHAATWLDAYARWPIDAPVGAAERMLFGQTKLPRTLIHGAYSRRYDPGFRPEGFVYFRSADVKSNAVARFPEVAFNRSKVYGNGGAEIYR
ncbi:MAG: DUF2206 domain-containing protein [Chloroflexi bacterium]|nr:DUF2206 domain-containing protein [Chloroflexota bacterium]